MKILIIGGGNMGMTYAEGFLKSHIVDPKGMMILEKSHEKAIELRKRKIGTVYGTPETCIPKADLIILAVKPQDTEGLFKSIQAFAEPQQVYLSIMAGVTINAIQAQLGIDKIVRAMPNLPAKIGRGMTVFTASDAVTRIELAMVQNLINTTGKSLYVSDESMIDATTAISGSGPAYVWYLMRGLVESGIEMGFTQSEAELLVSQTFLGAVQLYNADQLDLKEWIRRVCSKGGTTEAALYEMKSSGVLEKLQAGAKAALERAKVLGRGGK